MPRQQLIFFSIALFYLIIKIISYFSLPSADSVSLVVPGWHTVISYTRIYTSVFPILYFFAIGLIYGTGFTKTIQRPLFWAHVIFSIFPAAVTVLLPLLLKGNRFDSVSVEYQITKIIDSFFLVTQAAALLILLYLQIKNRMGRIT